MRVTSEDLINVFENTRDWYNSDTTLQKAVADSIANTKIYMEGEAPTLPEFKNQETFVSVSKYRTFQSAQFYQKKFPDSKIAVLNFASATNPGGGVEIGSRAQEEALCRCSTLYPTLTTDELWTKYYQSHRKRQDCRYTDACIYTPDILVIKSDTYKPYRLKSNEWIKVDVITCAAPNLSERPNNKFNPGEDKAIRISSDELFNIHISRAKQILTVAAHHGVDILILGAFGCGAFRNDPKIVANAYRQVVEEFKGYFKEIHFAIFCPSERQNENYVAFHEVFTGKSH